MLCTGLQCFAKANNKVLVVSSYGTDYQWSNNIIRRNSELLLQLISNILSISKFE